MGNTVILHEGGAAALENCCELKIRQILKRHTHMHVLWASSMKLLV